MALCGFLQFWRSYLIAIFVNEKNCFSYSILWWMAKRCWEFKLRIKDFDISIVVIIWFEEKVFNKYFCFLPDLLVLTEGPSLSRFQNWFSGAFNIRAKAKMSFSYEKTTFLTGKNHFFSIDQTLFRKETLSKCCREISRKLTLLSLFTWD